MCCNKARLAISQPSVEYLTAHLIEVHETEDVAGGTAP